MTTFIYALNDPETGLTRYIGKADDPMTRIKFHLSMRNTKASAKNTWVCSLLQKGLKPVVEILREVQLIEWEDWERTYIHWYNTLGFNLLNITTGGNGKLSGSTCSPMTRERMGAAKKGKVLSLETRHRMSLAHKGFKNPEFGSPGNKNSMFGKKHSQESIQKMRDAKKGSCVGSKNPRFGKPVSLETREKIRNSLHRHFLREKQNRG